MSYKRKLTQILVLCVPVFIYLHITKYFEVIDENHTKLPKPIEKSEEILVILIRNHFRT